MLRTAVSNEIHMTILTFNEHLLLPWCPGCFVHILIFNRHRNPMSVCCYPQHHCHPCVMAQSSSVTYLSEERKLGVVTCFSSQIFGKVWRNFLRVVGGYQPPVMPWSPSLLPPSLLCTLGGRVLALVGASEPSDVSGRTLSSGFRSLPRVPLTPFPT